MKSIYLIKVTRRPTLLTQVTHGCAHDVADMFAVAVARMQGTNLLPAGCSIQIVDSQHDASIAKIEIGDIKSQGIPVEWQINGV